MKDELLQLYKEYCDYIDSDDIYVTQHNDLKKDLYSFMQWLDNGFLFKFKN